MQSRYAHDAIRKNVSEGSQPATTKLSVLSDGMISSCYQAVIFDCDGVLVDSESLIVSLLVEMTNDLGGELTFADGDILFRGVHLAGCLDRIAQHLGAPLPPGFAQLYERRSADLMCRKLASVAGAERVVSSLKVPACVASNSSLAKVELMLAATGLIGYFGQRIYSAGDIGQWKPAPDVYLRAAAALDLPAAVCVAVEDSEAGVRSAASAGMAVIGFASPQRAPALLGAGAVAVCQTMEQVERLLNAVAPGPHPLNADRGTSPRPDEFRITATGAVADYTPLGISRQDSDC